MSSKVKRLYEIFQPDNYNLNIKLDPENNKFSGQVTATGKRVGRPSKRFTFHQKELKIVSATITKHTKNGNERLKIIRINNQDTQDEVRLHTKELIYPGQYTISLKFSGNITRPMNGIYPCLFKEGKTEKSLIATQFESHHAREAFPCIDEPEAKAVFKLELDTPKSKAVISNTEVKSSVVKGARQLTKFAETPKMSTYLLAFVVGDLEYLESKTKAGVTVRTYATKDNVAFTKFTLECAVKTLDYYNQYFDVPYPLNKCDFIALPDFAAGAMENWGCITFREQAMFVDPKNTSLSIKQHVANVVAHELTHQWFGNLVTMRWWTDLWLNESFASWMSYLAVDHMFPEWKVWTQFAIEEQAPALKLDALENTHPIEVEVKHPDEIRTIFDAISYEKGASIITMLNDYLGPEVFRDGIRLYLKTHSYSNTDTVDLWDALEKSSEQPIKQFMGHWTSLSGYPLVRASYSSDSLKLAQERFYLNPLAKKSPSVWPIPLLNKDVPLATLVKSSATLELTKQPASKLLNEGRQGFYRTIYDANSLKQIVDKGIDKLSDVDRLGLLGDALESAKAGYSPTVDALSLLKAYDQESSVVVWEIIAGAIGSIRMVMNDDDLRDSMKPFIRKFTAKQLDRLGLEETKADSHFDKLLRPIIVGMSAVADEPKTLSFIKQQFATEKSRSNIAPDIRSVVYSTIARLGGKSEFDTLLKMHNSSNSSEDRVNLTAALTGFEQPELIKKALVHIKSDDVRLQDVAYWVVYSFSNRFAREQAWQWLQDNWDWLEKNLGDDLSFYRMPNYVARCYSDKKFLKEYKAFFTRHLSISLDRPLKQGIETIEWQSEWRSRDLDSIKSFFK